LRAAGLRGGPYPWPRRTVRTVQPRAHERMICALFSANVAQTFRANIRRSSTARPGGWLRRVIGVASRFAWRWPVHLPRPCA